MWIQTGVTVRKRLSWVVTSVTLTFDLWQWWKEFKLSSGHRRQTDGHLREKTQLYCDENRQRFFCLLRIIQESGVYQLGVPQGQGDSSAPSTTDPLICGFCLVTTPNTRGKTVEQSTVTWMFAREFITNNRHPGEPQLTNKLCTNGRLREKHHCIVMRIDEDSSAYSKSLKRVECTNWEYRTDGQIDEQGESSIPPLTSLRIKKVQKTFRWLGVLLTHPSKCFCPPEGQKLPNHDENQ